MATRIYTKGFDELNKKLFFAQNRARKPKSVVAATTIRAWREIVRHFDTASGRRGKWKKLKKATIKRKGSSNILEDTGRLRSSLRWRAFGSNKGVVFTNLIYAATHNYGRDIKGGKIPKREFMWLPKNFVKDSANKLLKFITGAF